MRLNLWMEYNNLTRRDLASRLGYAQNHVYQVLCKTRKLSKKLVNKVYTLTGGLVTQADWEEEGYHVTE